MMLKKSMWMIGFVLVTMAAVSFLSGCSSLPENAAVTVNGVVISKDDVANRIRIGAAYKSLPDPSSDEYDRIKRGTAEQLAAEEVEKQEAAARGITVTPDEINPLLDQVVEDQFYGDQKKMEDDFASRNITVDDLRQQLARTVLHNKLLESIRDEVPVTDDEVKAEYERNKSNYVYPEKRQVRQVVVADQATAQSIADRIRGGEDMAVIAGKQSIDTKTKTNGGLVGLVTREQLSQSVGDAAYSLQTNQVSDPFKSDLGWYVVRVELIVPAANITYDQYKDKLKELMSNQRLAEHYKTYVEEVKQRYEIKYADDYAPRTDDASTTDTTAGAAGATTTPVNPSQVKP